MSLGRHEGIVRLFEAEADLLANVPHAEAEIARERTVVSYVEMPKGPVAAPALRADPFDLGFLVLEGLLLRRVEFVGRRAVEVLGPGDVIRPWRAEPHFPSIPSEASWKVCEPARIALLDRRFEQGVARWPGVISSVLDRLDARSTALALQLALAQVPRLDDRLLCVMWHLADRFGRRQPDGISVPLGLSQETLAGLTSSRRPSVSTALRSLRERDLVLRPRPGMWLLRGEPPTVLARAAGSRLGAEATG